MEITEYYKKYLEKVSIYECQLPKILFEINKLKPLSYKKRELENVIYGNIIKSDKENVETILYKIIENKEKCIEWTTKNKKETMKKIFECLSNLVFVDTKINMNKFVYDDKIYYVTDITDEYIKYLAVSMNMPNKITSNKVIYNKEIKRLLDGLKIHYIDIILQNKIRELEMAIEVNDKVISEVSNIVFMYHNIERC
jgi:hypothetical protein